MKIYTIGFTKKSAAYFFETLRESGARGLVDVRLNNVSQLAGFAKKDDLEFFLRNICNMNYAHLPELAPTKEMLDSYRKQHKDWETYEHQFVSLMDDRQVSNIINKDNLADSCLLCSEHEPDHCHRRLVSEYFKRKWGDVDIIHLI